MRGRRGLPYAPFPWPSARVACLVVWGCSPKPVLETPFLASCVGPVFQVFIVFSGVPCLPPVPPTRAPDPVVSRPSETTRYSHLLQVSQDQVSSSWAIQQTGNVVKQGLNSFVIAGMLILTSASVLDGSLGPGEFVALATYIMQARGIPPPTSPPHINSPFIFTHHIPSQHTTSHHIASYRNTCHERSAVKSAGIFSRSPTH